MDLTFRNSIQERLYYYFVQEPFYPSSLFSPNLVQKLKKRSKQTFRYSIQERLILLFTGTIVSPAAVRRVNDGPHNTSTPKNNTTTVISSSEADLQPETPKSTKQSGRKIARKSISVVSPAVNVSTYLHNLGSGGLWSF